jgi:hypothetical protein
VQPQNQGRNKENIIHRHEMFQAVSHSRPFPIRFPQQSQCLSRQKTGVFQDSNFNQEKVNDEQSARHREFSIKYENPETSGLSEG